MLINGVTHKGSGFRGRNNINATKSFVNVWRIWSYVLPTLSGIHNISINYVTNSRGTSCSLFLQQQFSYLNPSYHEIPWCPEQAHVCDSTKHDSKINFDCWLGATVDLPHNFPIDAFSIQWSGNTKPTTSEIYDFLITINGGVQLKIGNDLLIDQLP